MSKTSEFTFSGHRFRLTPIPAIPLAQELHKLLVRFDHDAGVLNTLAFNFDRDDYAAIFATDPTGIAKLLKLLSMLLKTDDPVAVGDADEDESAPKKALDVLPVKLDELCLYYAQAAQVECCIGDGDHERWLPLQTEDEFNAHPLRIAPFLVAYQVLRECVFGPFVSPLLAFMAEREAAKATASTEHSSESAETDSPEAQI